MSDPSALQVALRGLGIDPQAELARYRRACRARGLVPAAPALPDRYLASSEQLLQQIAASTPLRHRRRPSPWAIAGAAAFVCALGLLARGLQQSARVATVGSVSATGSNSVALGPDRTTPIAPSDRTDIAAAGLAALPHVRLPADSDLPNNPANDRGAPRETSPGSASELVAAEPEPEADFFYVTLAYSATNLTRVKQWVPDAFVVEFPVGNLIQAGAFYRRDRAERAAQELQRHQLQATVYRP